MRSLLKSLRDWYNRVSEDDEDINLLLKKFIPEIRKGNSKDWDIKSDWPYLECFNASLNLKIKFTSSCSVLVSGSIGTCHKDACLEIRIGGHCLYTQNRRTMRRMEAIHRRIIKKNEEAANLSLKKDLNKIINE